MMRSRTALAAVLSVLLTAWMSPAVAGPIVVNGSFEIGPSGAGSSIEILTGPPELYGWTALGSTSIDYLNAPWNVADGTHAVDLDGFSSLGGGVSQSFATVPGGIYSVDFDLPGNPDGDPVQKWVRVAVGNFTQDYMLEVVPHQPSRDISWRNVTFDFTATDSTSTLSFTSLTPYSNHYGAYIDDVHVNGPVTYVPDPGSSLLLFGMGLVGRRASRKRQHCQEEALAGSQLT